MQPLLVSTLFQQCADLAEQAGAIERLVFQLELASIHLGEVEDVADQLEQALTGLARRMHVISQAWCEIGILKQPEHT